MKVAIVLANLVTLVYKYMYMLYLIMKIDNIVANLVILDINTCIFLSLSLQSIANICYAALVPGDILFCYIWK